MTTLPMMTFNDRNTMTNPVHINIIDFMLIKLN